MRIAELLFGLPFLFMALWALGTGEIYVISDKTTGGEGGGWASVGEHPLIFLLALGLYGFTGIVLVRAGLKGD